MIKQPKNSNSEKLTQQKIIKNTLTDLSAALNLKTASKSPHANRCVLRQFTGGKEEIQQPPHVSGIFLPVNLSGDVTILSRGYGIEKRSRVNTCGGLPVSHLRTRDSFKTVTTLDKRQDYTAMNAITHGTATPVAATQGANPDQSNDCLLPFSVLPDAINTAKKQAADAGKYGTGNAYADLLKSFHASIFPYLIQETSGNIALIARLLGIHRKSVIKYAESVGLYDQLGAGQGGVRS